MLNMYDPHQRNKAPQPYTTQNKDLVCTSIPANIYILLRENYNTGITNYSWYKNSL